MVKGNCTRLQAVRPGADCSSSEDSLEIPVTEVQHGIVSENLSGVACIVAVTSPEGEQEFEMAAGESVTVTEWR